MSNSKLPEEYTPYKSVWVCGNNFNNGYILIEVEGNPVFLIGKKADSARSAVWLNLPKPIGGKPKWAKIIDNNISIEPGFEVFESEEEGNEVSVNGMPLLQYRIGDGKLFITLINLTPVGLNIFGGLKALTISGNTLQNNSFENVYTMVGIGGSTLTKNAAEQPRG